MATLAETERLEDLSDGDLDRLEDRLLKERELDWTMRSRATAGRVVVFLLIAALFLVLHGMAERLVAIELGVVWFIGLYVLLLGGAVAGAWVIWTGIGMLGRQFLRRSLHYWPVTLYLIALFAGARFP